VIKVVKNFLNEEEKQSLLSWSLENYSKDFFVDVNMNPKKTLTRRTTRYKNGNKDQIIYPEIAYKIQEKILKYFNILDIKYPPVFKDGIGTGVGMDGDAVYEHVDPVYYRGTSTIHANFIVQKAETGGIIQIDKQDYDIGECDMLVFIPSTTMHSVNETSGNLNRVLWTFGFCVKNEEIPKIFKNDL
jgi:hypothetical protein